MTFAKRGYPHLFSVAPMMDWTDRHCRYFYRLLSKKTQLYTEMITTQAILNGNQKRLLGYDESEHSIVLQLGGSDPTQMAQCAKIAQDWQYDEVNINVGCPSDRVQSGHFGACLMKTPDVVAQCVDAMSQKADIPITVKCRIGVDEIESYEYLSDFIEKVSQNHCHTFVIHARKAYLKGLSPKENRTKPPLNYPWVYQIKQDFPELNVVLNGGIADIDESLEHLKKTDGVMLGRAIYHQPYLLSEVDNKIYKQSSKQPSREQVLLKLIEYIEHKQNKDVPMRSISRHILGLYHGEKNAKKFKRLLSGPRVELEHLYQWLDFKEKNERVG